MPRRSSQAGRFPPAVAVARFQTIHIRYTRVLHDDTVDDAPGRPVGCRPWPASGDDSLARRSHMPLSCRLTLPALVLVLSLSGCARDAPTAAEPSAVTA